MNRRNFIKKGSLLVCGAAITNGLFSRNLFAEKLHYDFSIDVVTGQPVRAIRLIESLIAHSSFRHGKINFDELRLHGSHIGDIAFFKKQRLIDFRHEKTELSQQLQKIGRSLSLPRKFDNPMLLRFYSSSQISAPQTANIFCRETLVKQLSIHDKNHTYRVDGLKGYVEIAVEDKRVRILSAACKHKTCVKMGAISQPGQKLICIPNQIRVTISGENRLGVDGVTF